MKTIELKNWQVSGKYPFAEYMEMKNKEQKCGMFGFIPATVPGSVYKDLQKAKIIKNPYKGLNSLDCEWVANRWWVYKCVFKNNIFSGNDTRKILHFNGVDNVCSVFLNGKFIARFEGINNPVKFDVTDEIQEENELKVVIESEPQEIGQLCRSSTVCTQKERFGYKWDFCVRLVNMGIYSNVYFTENGNYTFDSVKVQPVIKDGMPVGVCIEGEVNSRTDGEAEIAYRLKDGRKIKGEILNLRALKRGKNFFSYTLNISNLKLWYPNGYGEQKLYLSEFTIKDTKGISDDFQVQTGFKDLLLKKNPNTDDETYPYVYCVNGRDIYIKGFNVVPMKMEIGTENLKEIQKLLDLLKDCGTNLVRIWGGGIIASEVFYAECAKRGIMIMQDFLQSSSWLDDLPCSQKELLKKLKVVSEKAIKSRRNYVSLAVWTGGNELYVAKGKPCQGQEPSLRLLADLVKQHDCGRMFYPASPAGRTAYYNPDNAVQDEVHGDYKYYLGEYGMHHYDRYNRSTSKFNSEFGVDGVANYSVLKKILRKQDFKVADSLNNVGWRHFGDWWNTLDKVENHFGKMISLEDYIFASQFLQAEGYRYGIESNRRRAFENSGTILWQANEPSPNASCTNVIDYFNQPKLAYYAIKKAFAPVVPSARYDKMCYEKGEEIKVEFFITSEVVCVGSYEIYIVKDSAERIYEKKGEINVDNATLSLEKKNWTNDAKRGYEIVFSVNDVYVNKYYMLSKDENGICDLEFVKTKNPFRENLSGTDG